MKKMKVKEFYNLINKQYLNGSQNVLTKNDVKAVFDFFYGPDFAFSESVVNTKMSTKINKVIKLRIKTNEPVYSILEYSPFYGRFFKTNRHVLKPRLDTEIVLAEALKVVKPSSCVLDLCTGSGILGLTINLETNASVVCSDISPFAIKCTKQNIKLLGAKAKVVKSNMFKSIGNKFDVIVSNPPYINSGKIKTLEREVKNFDPRLALDGGIDGMKFYNIIKHNFINKLKPNGTLILEIGFNQATAIKNLFNGFDVKIVKDLNKLDRVAVIKIKEALC